jgi:uncharacterized protein YcfJ
MVVLLSINVVSSTAYAGGQDNILGSVIGSATGALIGYQFGGGHGKYATTALGAVGGYIIGGKVQDHYQTQEQPYQPDYSYQNNQATYIGQDDYMIKQQASYERKRRNMIRNGEADPWEQPYDISETQTSWDDPNN